MKAHPAAEVLPLLPREKLLELGYDMVKNGQYLPIIKTPDGRILDGRNRDAGAKLVGFKPRVEIWDGKGNAFAFVRSMNVYRRHLSQDQVSGLATELAARAAELDPPRGRTEGYVVEKLAADAGVGTRTAERAGRVRREGPEEFKKVIAGDLTLKQAERKIILRKKGAPEGDNSDPDERYTTRAQFELCLRLAGLKRVELDVAACDEAHVAKRYFTKADDGLSKRWDKPWWCNPPWSDIRSWVEEGHRAPAPGLMLLPSWTDREWWQELVEPARDQPGSTVWTRFLPRAPFGHPGNPTAIGIEQPEFWCVLLVFNLPMPSAARGNVPRSNKRKVKNS